MTKVNYITVGFVLLAALIAVLFVHPKLGYAKPSYFVRSAGTASATTSPQYMTAGNSTTTETFNTTNGTAQAMNSAELQLAIKSSTTVTTLFGTTTLSFRLEQSDNNMDWSLSTSSTIQTVTCEQMGSNCIASTSVTMRTIAVPSPVLRYIRALVGVNPGSSNNAAVWMQFVGERETN